MAPSPLGLPTVLAALRLRLHSSGAASSGTEADCKRMMRLADKSGDGVVNLDELLHWQAEATRGGIRHSSELSLVSE